MQTFGIYETKRSGTLRSSCGENCIPNYGRRFVSNTKLSEIERTFLDPMHWFLIHRFFYRFLCASEVPRRCLGCVRGDWDVPMKRARHVPKGSLYVCDTVTNGSEPRERLRPIGETEMRCVGPRSNSAQKMYFLKKRFPVRARASDAAANATAASGSAMATEQSGSRDVFDGKPYGGHGDVYRWLRRKFEFVSNWIKEESPAWDTIASRVSRDGIVDRNGKPLVGRLVRRVWTRVLKDVRSEQERKAEEAVAKEASRLETSNGCHFWKEISARSASDLATTIGGWAWQCREAAKSHTPGERGKLIGPRRRGQRSLEREFIRPAFADAE